MWNAKTRKIADLTARVEQLAEERDEAQEERDTSRRALIRLATAYTHLLDTGEPMAMFAARPSKEVTP